MKNFADELSVKAIKHKDPISTHQINLMLIVLSYYQAWFKLQILLPRIIKISQKNKLRMDSFDILESELLRKAEKKNRNKQGTGDYLIRFAKKVIELHEIIGRFNHNLRLLNDEN